MPKPDIKKAKIKSKVKRNSPDRVRNLELKIEVK
jgi:hypothetical protein